MAEKKAAIRIEAKDAGFKRTLLGFERDAKSTAKSMGSSFRSELDAGIKGGLSSVKSMFSSIKSAVGGLTGLAGGIGFGALVKGAMDSEAAMRKLSFSMGAGKGQFQDWQALQKQVGESALKWSQNSAEMADAMGSVAVDTGDAEFAKATMDALAQAAQASGQKMGTLAPLVSAMNEQFGITAADVPDALATLLSLSSRGGMSIEELSGSMGKLGRLSGLAGFEGKEGFGQMLGLANAIADASGSAKGSTTTMVGLISTLAGKQKELKQKWGIDAKGGPAAAIEQALKKSKGDAAKLQEMLGEQGIVVAQSFGKRFQQVLAESGGTPTQKLDAAVADFQANLAAASKSSLTAADVQAKAVENNKSAASGISRAVETMQQAFEKPEMQSAIAKLAENLPAFAEAVAKAMEWIMKNPVMAAGVLVGGKAASGALEATLFKALTSGGTSAGKSVAGEMTTAGAGIGASLKGALASGGVQLAAAIGVALAVDQASKLSDDLDQRQKDIADERENLLGAAEQRGEGWARREKPMAEWTAEDVFGAGETGVEYLSRGKGGKVLTSKTEPLQAKPVDVPLGDDLSPEEKRRIDRITTTSETRADPRHIVGEKEIDRRVAAMPGAKADPTASARAMADAMASRILRVEVTNADELRNGPTKPPGGGPGPGYAAGA
jgi:TP901 family phage tail tape measure protein